MPPQMGWRLPGADEALYLPLFKRAQHDLMHKIEHGKTVSKWDHFVVDIFKEVDEFKQWADANNNGEPLSTKSIRTQYDQRITEFKNKFGWNDGRCRNLSGEEGDLSELDKIIKDMLMEQYQFEQEKKTKAADSAEVALCETSVLINALGEKAKSKRKYKKVDGSFNSIAECNVNHEMNTSTDDSAITVTTKSTGKPSDTQLFYEAIRDLKEIESPNKRKLVVAEEQEVETYMKQQLQNINTYQLLDLAFKRNNLIIDYSQYANLDSDLDVDVLIEVYCSPTMGFKIDYVQSQFRELGLSTLQSIKLYTYFKTISNECISSHK